LLYGDVRWPVGKTPTAEQEDGCTGGPARGHRQKGEEEQLHPKAFGTGEEKAGEWGVKDMNEVGCGRAQQMTADLEFGRQKERLSRGEAQGVLLAEGGKYRGEVMGDELSGWRKSLESSTGSEGEKKMFLRG